MVCVLFSRPKHDGTLVYLHYYSKELVALSVKLGYKTINKEYTDANKDNITKIINKVKPNLIMFNGHGSPEIICGHKDKIIISSQENPELLKDTITYSFSCSSASILGKKAVAKGAICFIGYEFNFFLGRDPESEATPSKDKIAKLFMEPSNLLFSQLLRGYSAQSSIKKAKKMMNDNIWYLNTTKEFPEASHYAPFLYGNYLGLIVVGNDEASIND